MVSVIDASSIAPRMAVQEVVNLKVTDLWQQCRFNNFILCCIYWYILQLKIVMQLHCDVYKFQTI